MEIIKLPLAKIKRYAKNAKKHTEEQIQHIVNSIEKFGFNDPIAVWGDDNICIEGHGRLLALERKGVKDVDCIRLDHLSDEERRAYTLAHNQTTLETLFDYEMLNTELLDLKEFPAFDMTEFGFIDQHELFKEKNKEVKLHELTGDFTFKLKYDEADYTALLERLQEIDSAPERFFFDCVMDADV